MFIQEVTIKNFRGLDIDIKNLKEDFLIIGKNDSGKSNFCYAIRKVLDYSIRRIPLTINESTNCNKEDITINMKIKLENISLENKNHLSHHIEKINNEDYICVFYNAVFCEDTNYYNENIKIGSLDSKDFATNVSNPLDKVIDIIYINPNYDFEKDKKTFFKLRQQKNTDDKEALDPLIVDSVNKLNDSIQGNDYITGLSDEINSQDGFGEIFEEVEFKIKSNIDISNIYKSLDIIPYVKNTDDSINIGDGKSKTLSMLLQRISYKNEKCKIFIVEEPENHLYPLLQKFYVNLTSKFNLDQMIYTSHSPYIIDYRKMGQILKFIITNTNGHKRTYCETLNIDNNDYEAFGFMLNEEISEMFFYDKVLLVEGDSEKYFYNALTIKDEKFHSYLVKNKMGIFSVYGIDFAPAKKILNKLGIKVLIKTDNDIFPKQRRYAGIDRVLNCLDESGKERLCKILNINELTKEIFKYEENETCNSLIEEKMTEITSLFKEYGVLLSCHHGGFEKDFLEFIGQADNVEDFNYLKEAKLKNLHKYIVDNKVELTINEDNKNSILVGFMNE